VEGWKGYRERLERALEAVEKAEGELRAAVECLERGDEVLALAHTVGAGLIADDAVKMLRELVDAWSAALTREVFPKR
jgi:cellobiose-specific phosphotransferase system component IIA